MLRKETTACKTRSTHKVRTCRASARSTRFPSGAGASAFFYLGRLLQGPDFRLELRDFLPISSLRFPVFADFLGALDGLPFPFITTADDLRVLKHGVARAWWEADILDTFIKFSQSVPAFFSCRLAATSRERKKLPETANFDRLAYPP